MQIQSQQRLSDEDSLAKRILHEPEAKDAIDDAVAAMGALGPVACRVMGVNTVRGAAFELGRGLEAPPKAWLSFGVQLAWGPDAGFEAGTVNLLMARKEFEWDVQVGAVEILRAEPPAISVSALEHDQGALACLAEQLQSLNQLGLDLVVSPRDLRIQRACLELGYRPKGTFDSEGGSKETVRSHQVQWEVMVAWAPPGWHDSAIEARVALYTRQRSPTKGPSARPDGWEAHLRGWSVTHGPAPVQRLNDLANKHDVMLALQHGNIPTGVGAEPFNLRGLRLASATGAEQLPEGHFPHLVWNLTLDWEEENQKKASALMHKETEPVRRIGMVFELASIGERLAEKWAAQLLTPFEAQRPS